MPVPIRGSQTAATLKRANSERLPCCCRAIRGSQTAATLKQDCLDKLSERFDTGVAWGPIRGSQTAATLKHLRERSDVPPVDRYPRFPNRGHIEAFLFGLFFASADASIRGSQTAATLKPLVQHRASTLHNAIRGSQTAATLKRMPTDRPP